MYETRRHGWIGVDAYPVVPFSTDKHDFYLREKVFRPVRRRYLLAHSARIASNIYRTQKAASSAALRQSSRLPPSFLLSRRSTDAQTRRPRLARRCHSNKSTIVSVPFQQPHYGPATGRLWADTNDASESSPLIAPPTKPLIARLSLRYGISAPALPMGLRSAQSSSIKPRIMRARWA